MWWHVSAEGIRRLLRQQPFTPFRLVLDQGYYPDGIEARAAFSREPAAMAIGHGRERGRLGR
jgi:hypothetical protein